MAGKGRFSLRYFIFLLAMLLLLALGVWLVVDGVAHNSPVMPSAPKFARALCHG